jgi:secreted trypsin-like serine protease
MLSRTLAISALFVALVTGVGVAGTIRDDRDAQFYVSLAAQAKYASVGQLHSQGDGEGFVASAVLISRKYALTTAHTVDHASSVRFSLGGATYNAARWVVHPGWTGDLARGFDLAVIELSSPVLNVAPAIRYVGSSEVGMTVTLVGYGKTGTGVTGATEYDGRKRAGTNVIDAVYTDATKNNRILVGDFDNPHRAADSSLGSSVPTSLEFEIGPGDSGGGLFVDTMLGTRLIGINSFGAASDGVNNGDYGDTFGSTRLSLFNSWISSIMLGFLPGGRGFVASPQNQYGWITPTALDERSITVPEPESAVSLAIGLLSACLWIVGRSPRAPGDQARD